MRQIVAYLAASVDGYIAGPDDDLGWLPQVDDDAMGIHDFISQVGAIAMGRRTYTWILEHSATWPYGDVPAYVLSRTLPEGRAAHAAVTPGPLTDLAVKLREGEGTAWLVGGGRLFAGFAAAGLIDRWIITVGSPRRRSAALPVRKGRVRAPRAGRDAHVAGRLRTAALPSQTLNRAAQNV